jgi:MFS family permease
MVIESWLNERATNENRGSIFGLYMLVTYGALMVGQMIVATGNVRSASLFMVTGILYCASLIPTAVSTAAGPAPIKDVSLDIKALYAHSPVALIGCLLVGVANGAWGTLGAVYGARISISTFDIALMMSLTGIAGALMQIPVGRVSDRTDRRFVLAAAAGAAAVFGVLVFLVEPRSGFAVIFMTACYGAFAYTLYALAVAHANDHADPDEFVKVSSGLLLMYGFGTMVGPLVGSALMSLLRPESLFLATALAHASLAAYAVLRIRARAPVPIDERDAFHTVPAERAMTPQSVQLDPRTGENGDNVPEEQAA